MDAWEKFKSFVADNNLVKSGDGVLIAVSGGPDSVCLAHLFWRLKKLLPIKLFIVNMDHGLRRGSPKESKKVEELAKKLSLPVMVKKIGVRAAADSGGISLETAGRNLRYRTLFSIAREKGFNKVATGHTANDNAETVLMWLMRGTGSEGLSGIPVLRKGEGNIRIIRPILSVTREEVMDYIKRQKLDYSIDSSNLELDFTRNRIRHKVIPVLRQFNPKIVEHVFNLSKIVGADNEFLNDLALSAVKRISRVSRNGISIDLKRFFEYNEAVKQRVLKEILPEKKSLINIRRLGRLVLSENQKEILLSKRWLAEKRNNTLFLRKI
jgi:tRNA(Ile)-lysidine synthase